MEQIQRHNLAGSPPEPVTMGQLSRTTGLSRSRIRRWIARGYLRPEYTWTEGYQEWAVFPAEEVERAKGLKWLVDTLGILPSKAVERLPDVDALARAVTPPETSALE